MDKVLWSAALVTLCGLRKSDQTAAAAAAATAGTPGRQPVAFNSYIDGIALLLVAV